MCEVFGWDSIFKKYDADGSGGLEVEEDDDTANVSEEVRRATTRAQNLAMELINRSIKPSTRVEHVETMLVDYAKESLASLMVDPDAPEFREQINAVVSTVIDSYDDILKLFVEDQMHR